MNRAMSLRDLILPGNLRNIYRLCRVAGVDPEKECKTVFGVSLAELSKEGGERMLSHVKRLLGEEPKEDDMDNQPTITEAEYSTNTYWVFGGNENKEVFNLQTTVRGGKDAADHIHRVKLMLSVIMTLPNVHAKAVGGGSGAPVPKATAPEKWTSIKGKPVYKLDPGEEPPAVLSCPIHNVPMKKKDGQYGPFYSHKDGENWCNSSVKAA